MSSPKLMASSSSAGGGGAALAGGTDGGRGAGLGPAGAETFSREEGVRNSAEPSGEELNDGWAARGGGPALPARGR
jgi:hypothetical protein